tara:strand:+ start:82 stop:345 length:264 start_codon:yes stop_codon:yes gene_type:complete
MNNDIENLKKRLIYRSQYRGTKEMDKLISSFVEANINKFDYKELFQLEKFLNIDDDTLYKFYTNQLILDELDNSKITELFKNYEYKK